MVSVDDYGEVKDCLYKDEHYSARDNGAIMRHQREGMRKRKLDNVWSFGIPNIATGYMDFCGERVHRIVATAFLGPAPTDQHVVDHIDTNRQNNRPDNLRWLTKLENILCNETTRKKIELICGSIEAFLDNPQLLYGYESVDTNFLWMRKVTKEEAKICRENWNRWAKTAKPNPNYNKNESHIGEWIYKTPIDYSDNPLMRNNSDSSNPQFISVSNDLSSTIPGETIEEDDNEPTLYDSLTPSAKQVYWRTPTEFPCCPKDITEDGLVRYMNNLKADTVFSRNQYNTYYVVDKGLSPQGDILFVTTYDKKDEFGSWGILAVTIENDKFIHESINTRLGKELSEAYLKHLTGQREMTEEESEMIDCLS